MTPEYRISQELPTRTSVQEALAKVSLMDVDLEMEPDQETIDEMQKIEKEWGLR